MRTHVYVHAGTWESRSPCRRARTPGRRSAARWRRTTEPGPGLHSGPACRAAPVVAGGGDAPWRRKK